MSAPKPLADFVVPRCAHGNIILGCGFDDCAEQNAYLADQETAMARWREQEAANARAILAAFGLVTDPETT